MSHENTVYVVHAVDTEGPLFESLSATFERIKEIFSIELSPSYENLQKLRTKRIDLGGKEDTVEKFIAPSLLNYQESWDKIDHMLSIVMSKEFRQKLLDSFGGGWIYNWHCIDHVGYDVNPRGRDIGYHNIRDRYLEFLDKYESTDIDAIEWHFHPMSTYREAHRCATSYENSPHLHESLCRRILERKCFPSVFRAGFQAERPDSHWFLEQWIPFDCSNMAIEKPDEWELYNDFKKGRSGDWRRAPADWSVYNPDVYDYQNPGKGKRYIARFLNMNTRIANITQEETDKAFRRAAEGKPALLGVTDHDFRDMAAEVDLTRELIAKSSQRYPDVKFRYAKAKDAFNAVVHNGKYETLRLDVEFYTEDGNYILDVVTKSSDVFGPQPYLAIKTKGNRFIHDNLDFGLDGQSWHYVFDTNTVVSSDLDAVGIAANNKYGDTFIKVIKV